MESFGERLAKLRLKKSLSQSELAERLKIAKSTLAMYETDKREPSFEIVKKLASFFDVTTDYLLTGNSEIPGISSDEAEFLKWVDENLEGDFYYDFNRSPEEIKQQVMEDLRYLWEREKKKREREKK